jgi:glutamate carboxypeptidase
MSAEAALPADCFDLDEMLAGIAEWAHVESPSTDAAAVNRMMDIADAAARRLGARVERRAGRDGLGDLLIAKLEGASAAPGILVLAHLDTVHAVGTIAGPLPVRREGDRLYGPGVYDMKGGAYIALCALAAIRERGERPPLPVTLLFVPDEELGSPSSRNEIEQEARRHAYVLVPEPAQDHGNLITGRWAFQRFWLRTRGRPAHAGATLSEGRSAIREMAEQIIRVEALSEPERNVTLSVGVVHAGTFVNVVAPECEAQVLAVTPDVASFERVRKQMETLHAVDPLVELSVQRGPVRPLYEPGDATLALYARARQIARTIGFDPGHGTVGGGSDGNFTGALGIPTLDGLGVCGDGFHTPSEYAEISCLIPRARLLSGLFRSLR